MIYQEVGRTLLKKKLNCYTVNNISAGKKKKNWDVFLLQRHRVKAQFSVWMYLCNQNQYVTIISLKTGNSNVTLILNPKSLSTLRITCFSTIKKTVFYYTAAPKGLFFFQHFQLNRKHDLQQCQNTLNVTSHKPFHKISYSLFGTLLNKSQTFKLDLLLLLLIF